MPLTMLKTGKPSSRDKLHHYQERAVEFVKSRRSCALWMDMGLGKSVTVLTALADLWADFETNKVLIIAPLRVANRTWPHELKIWDHVSHLDCTLLTGAAKQRRSALSSPAPIHIINREMVVWLFEECGKKWPYDTIVIDESSSFKSPSTKRFKTLKKVLPQTARVIELTGTPASNGLLDVWSQIFLLDRGECLGRTFGGYKRKYFESDYMGYSFTPRQGSADTIYQKLSDIVLTLSADDYLELPKWIERRVPLQMPDSARKVYRDLERDFISEMESGEVVALSAAALANKLLQVANGAVYVGEEKTVQELHDAKLDALGEIIESAPGVPLLVAYNFKHDADRIAARFPQAKRIDERPTIIDEWNEGSVPLLLAHPASAGHGLNLQYGGHRLVWFGLNWSLELYQQFNARLHRQGQTRPVIAHHLVVEDSIDETVLAALADKDMTQSALLNALKTDIGARKTGDN